MDSARARLRIRQRDGCAERAPAQRSCARQNAHTALRSPGRAGPAHLPTPTAARFSRCVFPAETDPKPRGPRRRGRPLRAPRRGADGRARHRTSGRVPAPGRRAAGRSTGTGRLLSRRRWLAARGRRHTVSSSQRAQEPPRGMCAPPAARPVSGGNSPPCRCMPCCGVPRRRPGMWGRCARARVLTAQMVRTAAFCASRCNTDVQRSERLRLPVSAGARPLGVARFRRKQQQPQTSGVLRPVDASSRAPRDSAHASDDGELGEIRRPRLGVSGGNAYPRTQPS